MFIWIQPQGDRPVISCGKLEDDCRSSYKKLSDMIRKKEESAQDIRINDRELFSVYQEDYNLGAFSIMPKELLAKNEKALNHNHVGSDQYFLLFCQQKLKQTTGGYDKNR